MRLLSMTSPVTERSLRPLRISRSRTCRKKKVTGEQGEGPLSAGKQREGFLSAERVGGGGWRGGTGRRGRVQGGVP